MIGKQAPPSCAIETECCARAPLPGPSAATLRATIRAAGAAAAASGPVVAEASLVGQGARAGGVSPCFGSSSSCCNGSAGAPCAGPASRARTPRERVALGPDCSTPAPPLCAARSLFFKQEMELTLVGLQNSGKTTLVNVIAVRPRARAPCAGYSAPSRTRTSRLPLRGPRVRRLAPSLRT